MTVIANTYSFVDVHCDINGPGGAFLLSGSGNAKEGITVSYVEDKSSMVIGADGTPMHSLHAGQGATVTVRLLKTSPVNSQLMTMLNDQKRSAVFWGQNVIHITNTVRGDSMTCVQCSFRKAPDNISAEDGGTMEWVFNAGQVEEVLGTGIPQPLATGGVQ